MRWDRGNEQCKQTTSLCCIQIRRGTQHNGLRWENWAKPITKNNLQRYRTYEYSEEKIQLGKFYTNSSSPPPCFPYSFKMTSSESENYVYCLVRITFRFFYVNKIYKKNNSKTSLLVRGMETPASMSPICIQFFKKTFFLSQEPFFPETYKQWVVGRDFKKVFKKTHTTNWAADSFPNEQSGWWWNAINNPFAVLCTHFSGLRSL